MQIYTMGFTQKTAEEFFNKIKENKIEIVIDVRLNNQSQLAGFTKGRDLSFFLNEICDCKYEHVVQFAPTKEILQGYKKGEISWKEYENQYMHLMSNRKIIDIFQGRYLEFSRVLLLCSEPTPKMCHRRLLAEFISKGVECQIVHI